MKRLFLLLSIFVAVSCSKDDEERTSLEVVVKYEYNDTEFLASEDGVVVYLFKEVTIHDGYSPAANGKLVDEETGEEIEFDKKIKTSDGYVLFENLERTTYTVIVDLSESFEDGYVDNEISASSVNLNNQVSKDGGSLEFVFDIWPYSPTDVWK